MKKIITLLVAAGFLLTFQNAIAQAYRDVLGQRLNTITTAVPFLMIAPDSRAGAMGDAGVSSTPDANSMHWNPAKFAFIESEMGLSLNYTPWLRALVPDINLSYLSAFRRIDELQTVAFSLTYFTLGEINFTDEAGEFLFPVRPNEFSINVAYARKLGEHFSGAIGVRYIYSNLTQGQFVGGVETRPGTAIAADVSAFYTRELNWRTPTIFSAGINISNIGNKISYSDEIHANFIPINLRIGPSFTFNLDDYNQLSLMVDFNKLLVPTPPIYLRDETTGNVVIGPDGEYVIAAGRNPHRSVASGILGSFTDAPGGFREELNEITYSFGVEYWYDRQFALRAGYFHEHETKGDRKFFTLGLGLKYHVFGLDFAYLVPLAQRSPLENVLRFSLSFDFDALRSENILN
ncbi:MAG TPA: type IX secretion system outer membrane channel protein PorV [Bacteroidales bacterium]|nr:type IX secretion system outer membrane channel protein PorV [Bacteroidales bacterium]